MSLKGGGLLGTTNPYASGINRAIRALSPTLKLAPSTMGKLIRIGDRLTPAFAITGAFTAAYNASTFVQCSVGMLQ